MIAEPRKSASIILLREGKPDALETFLVRRSSESTSMGGFYVCPGGTLDEDDLKWSLPACLMAGLSPERLRIHGISIEAAIAHRVAAVRELFEETGILLAYDAGRDVTSLFSPANKEEVERLALYRRSLLEKTASFAQILASSKLIPALDKLIVYARWVTPEFHAIRFDNYFFLSPCPPGQEATPDLRETTEGVWLSLTRALAENLAGRIPLSPPTMSTLEDLSRFTTLGAACKSLDGSTVDPVRPVFVSTGGQNFVVFPWDTEFERFKAGRTTGTIDHGRPSVLGDRSTRAVFGAGRAIPYCKG